MSGGGPGAEFSLLSATAIAVGAGAGGLARWLVVLGTHALTGHGWPWGTFVVNLAGCFAAGFATAWFLAERRLPDWLFLGLVVGLLGGFTTYSAFARETVELLRCDRHAAALGYVAATNAATIGAAWLGFRIAA